MVRKSNVTPALKDLTRGEARIRKFANSNLTPEQSRQQAASLLVSKDISQSVLSLLPEDRTKFIDRVDQVYRDG